MQMRIDPEAVRASVNRISECVEDISKALADFGKDVSLTQQSLQGESTFINTLSSLIEKEGANFKAAASTLEDIISELNNYETKAADVDDDSAFRRN